MRQELELAKLELTEKGKQAGIGAGMFGGAGVVGLYAAGALTACLDPGVRHRDDGLARRADRRCRLRRRGRRALALIGKSKVQAGRASRT